MNEIRKSSRPGKRGYALLITVVFIGVALLLLASVMNWSTSTARQTRQNNLYNSAMAAAEAADENLMASIWVDFHNGNLSNVSYYEGMLPTTTGWPTTYSFSYTSNGNSIANHTGLNFSGTYTNNFPAPIYAVLGQQYKGLKGWIYNCTASSTATAQNQPYSVPATVNEQFQLVDIPLCQFAIFYNMDLEICPGGDMKVTGPTFVNGNIWADPSSGVTLTFAGTVQTTANSVIYTRNTNDPQTSSSEYITYAGGTPHTDGSHGDVYYTITNSPQTNQAALVLPVGTNSYQFGNTNYTATNDPNSVRAILNLPPGGVDPNSQMGQEYLFNQSAVIVSNYSTGYASTNGSRITAYLQDPNNTTRFTAIPNNYTNIVSTGLKNGQGTVTGYVYATNIAYTFATNASFYDYREGKTVQAVQLNVGALNSWLSGAGSSFNTQYHNDTGDYIDSVYIYNNGPSDSSHLPSARVANGSVLPSQGLTVVTPDPLYVLGNYNASGSALGTTNVANTAPAGLMGDAITILSTGWSDAWTSSTALTSRNAGSTTVNAATLEGIVQSTRVGSTKYYSGGVENFLRLLENWSGDTLTYNGSIVVMFFSKYATNYWQGPGNYYNVPTRNWGFDANFSQSQNDLPPIFPSVPVMMRQGWTAK